MTDILDADKSKDLVMKALAYCAVNCAGQFSGKCMELYNEIRGKKGNKIACEGCKYHAHAGLCALFWEMKEEKCSLYKEECHHDVGK